MSNGFIKQVQDRNMNDVLSGEIRTMRHFVKFWLEKNTKSSGDKAPTHIIRCTSPHHGQAFDVGVAWERSINRGASIGGVMFSLSFSDPEFGDDPIYATAFPDGPGLWSISLERKRRAEPGKEGQAGDGGAGGTAHAGAMANGGDSLPY